METRWVERVLRDLPGVLDCSVHDEGIAIVVHPEIDPHMMELRAQVALAEIGERRPLLVVGGMSTSSVQPPRVPVRRARRGLGNRSPMSMVGFAVLVVALITVVPISGGSHKAPRLPSVAAPSFDMPSFDGIPVIDEPATVAAAAAAVVGPVAPSVRAVAQLVRHSSPAAAAPGVAAPAPVAVVATPAADPPVRTASVADAGRGHGQDKDKDKVAGKAKAKAKAKPAGKQRVKAAKIQTARGRGRR